MSDYTHLLRTPFSGISPEDEHFMDELLEVARLFRPFSEGMTEFLFEHGYSGDPDDAGEKTAFIRNTFEQAGMKPPREIRLWFEKDQPITRETAFQICFAFGLDGLRTDDFFRKVVMRERSFDCHQVSEAIAYFCLNHGLTWADAREMNARIPEPGENSAPAAVVYTDSIVKELNRMESKEELVQWLRENIRLFNTNNATAYRLIRDMWEQTAGKEGLLAREGRKFFSATDDPAIDGPSQALTAGDEGVKLWDAYLAIFQLDKEQVSRLEADRSIKPILDRLHAAAQDSFPDRQGMTLILKGAHVSYERVRKWLVLLTFFTWWARRALATGSYEAEADDGKRFLAFADHVMMEAGYPELYVGNPYDWIFIYCAQDQEPLRLFREIWNTLLGEKLERHS